MDAAGSLGQLQHPQRPPRVACALPCVLCGACPRPSGVPPAPVGFPFAWLLRAKGSSPNIELRRKTTKAPREQEGDGPWPQPTGGHTHNDDTFIFKNKAARWGGGGGARLLFNHKKSFNFGDRVKRRFGS
jgi:hypothetical protein